MICPRCNLDFPEDSFYMRRDRPNKNYKDIYCKKCRSKINGSYKRKTYHVDINVIEKKCNKCEQIKDVSEFYLNNRNKDGYSNMCKICQYQKVQKNIISSFNKMEPLSAYDWNTFSFQYWKRM